MHRIVPPLALLLAFETASVRADVPAHSWSQRFGGTVADAGKTVTVDNQGNVIVAGEFGGSMNMGGSNLVANATDIFVAKFDPGGAHQWSRQFSGALAQHLVSADVDASGNVVLIGHFESAIDCGGGALSSAGSIDVFLAKLDAGGAHVWSRRFGSPENYEEGRSVAFDGSGHVFVTGRVRGPVDFGGGSLAPKGYYDMFLAKYDGEGNHQWSQRFGGGDVTIDKSMGLTLTVDGQGNVIVSGQFYGGDLSLGGAVLAGEIRYDMFLAEFDGDGVHQWSKRFGVDGWWKESQSVAADGSGDIILMGLVDGVINFGGGFLYANGNSQDIFLARFDSNGLHEWSRLFGTSSHDEGGRMALDAQGNVVVSGTLLYPTDFGGGTLTSFDGSDVFLAEFDAFGGHRWSERFPGTGNQNGLGVACGPSGAILLTGRLSGYADFGGGYIFSGGSSDIFLARLAEILTAADETPASRILSISSFPNPFNPHTTISYTVPSRGDVTVVLYDARGARVATLVNRRGHPAGAFSVDWSGRGDGGAAASSGVYFARVEHDGASRSTKMVLLK